MGRARTELLVLITPHILCDQRDGQILAEELRDKLINAVAVPKELQSLPSGLSDPNRRIRHGLAAHQRLSFTFRLLAAMIQ